MLDSTIELITLAASNSLVVFCFCNLIIGILLVGGAKFTSEFGQESPIPAPTVGHRNKNYIEETITTCSLNNNDASTAVSELNAEKAMVDEEKESDNEDDDELRRRVEEFIDKINRGWKAEKLSPLV